LHICMSSPGEEQQRCAHCPSTILVWSPTSSLKVIEWSLTIEEGVERERQSFTNFPDQLLTIHKRLPDIHCPEANPLSTARRTVATSCHPSSKSFYHFGHLAIVVGCQLFGMLGFANSTLDQCD